VFVKDEVHRGEIVRRLCIRSYSAVEQVSFHYDERGEREYISFFRHFWHKVEEEAFEEDFGGGGR